MIYFNCNFNIIYINYSLITLIKTNKQKEIILKNKLTISNDYNTLKN